MTQLSNLDRATQMKHIARQRKNAAENALAKAKEELAEAERAVEDAKQKEAECIAICNQAKRGIDRDPGEEQRHIWLKKCTFDLEAAQTAKSERVNEASECTAAVTEAQIMWRKLKVKYEALEEQCQKLRREYQRCQAEKADEEQLENSRGDVHPIWEEATS